MPKPKAPKGAKSSPGPTAVVPVRIPWKMLAVLDRLSKQQGRPRANLIIFLLGERLREMGAYDPMTEPGPHDPSAD